MADLSKMSDAELYKLAGIEPGKQVASDMSKMGDEQLMQIAGIELEKPAMTGIELARGAAANTIQGATFGTGATISGLSNILATPAYKLAGNAMPKQTIGEQFSSGREAFEKPEREFAAEHPIAATGLQIAGSLPVALATGGGAAISAPRTLLAKMGHGVLAGAKYGAAYGAGSGLAAPTENILKGENASQSALDTVIGIGKGTATGAAMGAAVPLAGKVGGAIWRGGKSVFAPKSAAIDVVRSVLTREEPQITQFPTVMAGQSNPIGFTAQVGAKANTKPPSFFQSDTFNTIKPQIVQAGETPSIKQVIPPSLVEKSVKTNTPMIELADPDGSIHRLAMTAKLNGSDEAQGIIVKGAREIQARQSARLREAVDSVFGNKNHFQKLDEINETAKEAGAPLYKTAFEYGDLAQRDPSIVEYVKQPKLANEIAKARKDDLAIGLRKAADTDIRLLDIVKQNMDDEISKYMRNGEKNRAANLIELKNGLLAKMDAIAPEYQQARSIYSNKYALEEAMETGAKILRNETPESIERIMPTLSLAEQHALKLGFRDELMKQIGRATSGDRSNVALKVFNESENSLTRQNMRAILGDDYAPLMEKVNPIVKSGRNISDLMEGSQTAENQKISTRNLNAHGLNVHHMIKHGIIHAFKEQSNEKYTDIAKMLFDPNYLKKVYK